MRKLMLPLMAACATLGVVAIPATAGVKLEKKQNKRIGNLQGAVKGVESAIKNIEDINLGQTASVNDAHAKADAVGATVKSIVAGIPDIVNGLTALKAGLESAGAGLVALQAALTNQVTPALKLLETNLTALGGVVQGQIAPAVATFGAQAAAVGTDDPNTTQPAGNTTLPQGTMYRQITGGGAGADIWVKVNAPGAASIWRLAT